jgi:hypothetical protein
MSAKSIRIPLVCERCGTQFSVLPRHLRSNPSRRYCSRQCSPPPLEERYWAHVQKGPGCWLWTACISVSGYGQIWRDGRQVAAQRVGYELAYGPFDPALKVLHRCDVPACVRPDHLFLGTVADNARDMYAKGRFPIKRGEEAPRARLTEVQVREIRARYVRGVFGAKRLAKEYGVGPRVIEHVIHRRTWKHVD